MHLSLCITLFLLWASPLKCVPYHQISLNHHLVLLSTFLSFHLCSKPILHSHKFLIWIAPNLPNWFFSIHLRLEGVSMLFQMQIHYLHAEDEFCPFHIMFSFPTKLMGTMFLVLSHKKFQFALMFLCCLSNESSMPQIEAFSSVSTFVLTSIGFPLLASLLVLMASNY